MIPFGTSNTLVVKMRFVSGFISTTCCLGLNGSENPNEVGTWTTTTTSGHGLFLAANDQKNFFFFEEHNDC